MTDSEKCPYGLWGGKEACENRLHCLTTGEPKCMQSLGSGETVEQYLRSRNLWNVDSQK